jgi:hypothetical protein
MCIADVDRIDVRYFTAVCLNKQNVYEAASNGDNFITAYKAYISLDPTARAALFNETGRFVNWLKLELGLPSAQEKRIRQLFARPLWRYLCKKWNETQWGRASFQFQTFCDASGQHLDHVSQSPPLIRRSTALT